MRPRAILSIDLAFGFGLALLSLLAVSPAAASPGELDAMSGPTASDEIPKAKLAATPEVLDAGKRIYERRCLPCHGETGAGDGPAAEVMDPRPRDFTRGLFKIRSTAFNELPTDEDLFRTVSRGIPGSGMPAWKHLLSEQERLQVIAYVKTFSDKFKDAAPPKMIPMGSPPAASADLIAKGKELFTGKAACFTCHGPSGRGNGPLAVATIDAWGNLVYPRNLTKSWTYKGGNDVKDIFLRVSGSLNGTPMPAFLDTLSEEERWAVASFVKSIQKPVATGGKVVIESLPVSGEIPTDPSAPIWNEPERIEVLMTGQVHVAPRNQSPTVDLVWIQSVYNDKEIAFRLEWDDRTKNTTHDASDERVAKWEVPDPSSTYPVLYPMAQRLRNVRDAAALQFAVKLPQGPEKPHFFLGDTGKPVNLWTWKADTDTVEEFDARGFKNPAARQADASQQAAGKGVYDDGVWRVVIKRPLTTQDAANDVQFGPDQLIPVAVHVWDGHNGETGLRRTISSWYFVVLKTGVPAKVYATTVGLIGLIAGMEFWLVRRMKSKANP